MAKNNKPNKQQSGQEQGKTNNVAATQPESKTAPAAKSTNTRKVATVLGITILVILALILLALIISGLNSGNANTPESTDESVSQSENGEGEADGSTDGEEGTSTDSETDGDETSAEGEGQEGEGTDAGEGEGNGETTEPDTSSDNTGNAGARSSYSYGAGRGQGVSHLSRQAMNDFLADRGLTLSRAQRLFFEVTATNANNPVYLEVGETRTYSADALQNVYNQAAALTPGQLAAWDKAAVGVGYN